jgi:hypothetical protein
MAERRTMQEAIFTAFDFQQAKRSIEALFSPSLADGTSFTDFCKKYKEIIDRD